MRETKITHQQTYSDTQRQTLRQANTQSDKKARRETETLKTQTHRVRHTNKQRQVHDWQTQ